MRFTRRRDRCSTHATQHTALGPQRTRHHSRGAPWRKLAHARNQQPQVLLSAGDQLPQACGNQQPQAVLSLAFCPAGLIIIIIILRRPTAAGVSVRRTPAAAGASQPRSLLRRRTTTAGVSVRRKPAAAGASFVHTEGDWPCLSPLVGSCLRRDTPEAAAILGKSLSAIASTEELVFTASSVLLVLPASSVHHADYTFAITRAAAKSRRIFSAACAALPRGIEEFAVYHKFEGYLAPLPIWRQGMLQRSAESSQTARPCAALPRGFEGFVLWRKYIRGPHSAALLLNMLLQIGS